MSINPLYIISIFLVFVRIGALMMAAPLFSHPSIPKQLKVLISLLLAYGMVGFVTTPLPPHITQPAALAVAIGVEVLTGTTIGFAAQFIFWAVQHAGEVFGFQMGLSMAQAYDPVNGSNSNPMGRILLLTFLTVFVTIDGHHFLFRALAVSFEVVPLGGARLQAGGEMMLQWTGGLFLTALRLASPFMVTFFFVEASMGVFAKVVPQANLFILGIPLKLLIGFSMAIAFMQHFLPVIINLTGQMYDDLIDIISVLAS